MTRVRFEHIHASGRFSTTTGQLAAALSSYIEDAGVALITLTEVSAAKREAIVHDVARIHGWAAVTGSKGGMDDASVLWDAKVWRYAAGGTARLSDRSYDAPGGGRTYAAWAILDAVNGSGRLLAMSAHMPSSVETGGKWRHALARTRKWTADQRGYRRLWNDFATKYKTDAVLVSADWNVNIKRAFFRTVMRQRQPGMTPTLNYRSLPKAGTLGKRLIDYSFMRGKIKVIDRPQVMPQNSSSDHRPYRQTLELGA